MVMNKTTKLVNTVYSSMCVFTVGQGQVHGHDEYLIHEYIANEPWGLRIHILDLYQVVLSVCILLAVMGVDGPSLISPTL